MKPFVKLIVATAALAILLPQLLFGGWAAWHWRELAGREGWYAQQQSLARLRVGENRLMPRAWAAIGLPAPDVIKPAKFCGVAGAYDAKGCLTAALAFTSAAAGVLDGANDGTYQISDSVICATCSFTTVQHLGLTTPSPTWTGGSDPALSFTGTSGQENRIAHVTIDATTAHLASGIYVETQSTTLEHNYIQHIAGYGIKINRTGSTVDAVVAYNDVVEWQAADPDFKTGPYTATCIWYVGGDGFSTHNIPHYCNIAMMFGDGTNNASEWRSVSDHPFNGCDGGLAGCSRTLPIDMYFSDGSSLNSIQNLYLDDGVVWFNNGPQCAASFNRCADYNSFSGTITLGGPGAGLCFYDTTHAQTAGFFVDVATQSNQEPLWQVSGAKFVAGFAEPTGCPDAGAQVNTWYGFANGGNFLTNGTELNDLASSATVSNTTIEALNENAAQQLIYDFVGSDGSAAFGCIDVRNKGTTAAQAPTVCNYTGTGGRDLWLASGYGGAAQANLSIDERGNFTFGSMNVPSCSGAGSGCSSAPTVTGNSLGWGFSWNTSTMTSPLTFSWGGDTNPSCQAEDVSGNGAPIGITTSAAAGIVTAVLKNGSPTNGDSIHVQCVASAQ